MNVIFFILVTVKVETVTAVRVLPVLPLVVTLVPLATAAVILAGKIHLINENGRKLTKMAEGRKAAQKGGASS